MRFWAGDTAANKATAPYRVLHDGSLFATKANIKGRVEADYIKATDGEFNGTSDMYSIVFDITNRKFIIKGPDDVISFDDLSPRSGAKVYEYLTIGDFFHTQGLMKTGEDNEYESVRITPKIIIKSPAMAGDSFDPQKNYMTLEIDPYNGIVMRTHTEWTGQVIEDVSIFSPSGVISGGQYILRNIPTSRDFCNNGQLYRDGENVKIRID